jgi:molybdopterin-biosynthesis enzyme MoeA-like protein
MQVALVTVGDELLAGDTENTNATWLARRVQ